MTCSQSLLYFFCCRFLNSSNSLSDFFVFLFNSSTSSTRTTELSCSPASCSRSVISTDVSALVELVEIPVFFKERFLLLAWEGGLPWERQRTLETTSVLVIGCYPSATGSACIAFIAPYKIQSVKY